MLLDVLLQRLLVAHHVKPGGGDDHRLRLAPDPLGDAVEEVLDDHFRLLSQVVLVQAHEFRDRCLRLRRVVGGIIFDGLPDIPVGLVGHVGLQHVEDEALPDCLAHRVEVEGLMPLGVGIEPPEQLQSAPFLRGGKCEEAGRGALVANRRVGQRPEGRAGAEGGGTATRRSGGRGRRRDCLRVDCEVDDGTPPQRDVVGIVVVSVLALGELDVLTGRLVLELRGRHRKAVHEQAQVELPHPPCCLSPKEPSIEVPVPGLEGVVKCSATKPFHHVSA